MKNRVRKNQSYSLVLMLLLILLIISILSSVTFGNAQISIKEVYSVLGYRLFGIESLSVFGQGAIHDVVWVIRFPRVLMALSVGMGLSVCGVVMQAIVKNALADPYVLGVSSGASMGATFAILFGFGQMFGENFVGVMAFLGAMLASFLVLLIANIRGRNSAGKLILAGMVLGVVCSAFSNFALYMTHDKGALTEVMFWTMGSLAGAKWDQVILIFIIMVLGIIIFWSQFRNLNLMLFGEEVSITLGINLYKARGYYMILASFMVGFCVYAVGSIGFVGLLIPHVVRMIFGTDHKWLIPFSAIIGGIFLIWADVLCRVILENSELPIGILVSMIGAPCFIYLMIKHSYGFGGHSS